MRLALGGFEAPREGELKALGARIEALAVVGNEVQARIRSSASRVSGGSFLANFSARRDSSR